MTSTEPNTSKSAKSGKSSSKSPRRQNRKPHELAVDAILRMPLGELAKTAEHLAMSDKETAEFFLTKLERVLNPLKSPETLTS